MRCICKHPPIASFQCLPVTQIKIFAHLSKYALKL
uniref:Uncharacterized protein n=1 Tax=Arundo donax TaxID=35708 RepID=A0A0A9H074_ARUDO